MKFCEKTKSWNWATIWTAIGALATLLSAGSIIIAVVSLHDGERAMDANNLALRNNVQQSMTQITLTLDQIFVEHPELRPYFDDGANPTNTLNYYRACEASIMTLDVFDVALAQTTTFKDQWSSPEGWTNWISDAFAKSPFLREQYLQHTQWYGADMFELEQQATNAPFYISKYK